MNFQTFVFHWNIDRSYQLANYYRDRLEVNPIQIIEKDHETKILNHALDLCELDYAYFVTDEEIIYPETVRWMAEWLDEHPDVGLIRPNIEGEPRNFGGYEPYDKYLSDGTSIIIRKSTGVRFDEEFLFTGWSDLDIGEEMMHQGFKVQVDPRTSVLKQPTHYANFSTFRKGYNARNRLLLEAKWYWCGRDDWQGVDEWNKQNPIMAIPTIFELAWWSDQRLEDFAESVNMEHPQILIKDGQDSGNTDWRIDNV